MSKSSIYEKIEEKGKLEAQQIIDASTQKALELSNSIINEMQNKIDNLIANAKYKCEDAQKSTLTSTEQNAKQAILAHKKELIHNCFEKTCASLKNLSDEELIKYVNLHLDLSDVTTKVYVKVCKDELSRYATLFSSNSNAEEVILDKLSSNLVLSKECANIRGGFILECPAFDVDNSYDAILETLEEAMEKEIANCLFGEE